MILKKTYQYQPIDNLLYLNIRESNGKRNNLK